MKIRYNKTLLTIIIVCFTLTTIAYNTIAKEAKKIKMTENDDEKWAIIIEAPGWAFFNLDAIYMYRTLINNGWKENNIKLLIGENTSKEKILEALKWMKLNEDKNDTLLFYYAGYGGFVEDKEPLDEADRYDEYIHTSKNNEITDDELNEIFNDFSSTKVLAIFNSCYSGGMIDGMYDLNKQNRVILAACRSDQEFYRFQGGKSTFGLLLSYGFNRRADINKDKIVSAEEAFYFSEPRMVILNLLLQHPQIYDGCEDELDIINLS
jgi:hypothetical protein